VQRVWATKEYPDGDFLRALGMQQSLSELSAFWPNRRPCWDALGRIERDGKIVGCLMVEAKSCVDEFYANDTGAKGVSLEKIHNALSRAVEWLDVPPAKAWTHFPDPKRCLYQMCQSICTSIFISHYARHPCISRKRVVHR
jgi:hypothetical protein